MAGATLDKNEGSEAPKPGNENGGPSGSEGSSNELSYFSEKRRGRCKWFNVAKGWGFITPDDGTSDVFVHQSVIKMTGFRSLGDKEVVEFVSKLSDRGIEATHVSGIGDSECKGSNRRPQSNKNFKKIRCYNCGEFANHLAAKCSMDPQPKKCHYCKSERHLVSDCPYKVNQKIEIEKDNALKVSARSRRDTKLKKCQICKSENHLEADCSMKKKQDETINEGVMANNGTIEDEEDNSSENKDTI